MLIIIYEKIHLGIYKFFVNPSIENEQGGRPQNPIWDQFSRINENSKIKATFKEVIKYIVIRLHSCICTMINAK